MKLACILLTWEAPNGMGPLGRMNLFNQFWVMAVSLFVQQNDKLNFCFSFLYFYENLLCIYICNTNKVAPSSQVLLLSSTFDINFVVFIVIAIFNFVIVIVIAIFNIWGETVEAFQLRRVVLLLLLLLIALFNFAIVIAIFNIWGEPVEAFLVVRVTHWDSRQLEYLSCLGVQIWVSGVVVELFFNKISLY